MAQSKYGGHAERVADIERGSEAWEWEVVLDPIGIPRARRMMFGNPLQVVPTTVTTSQQALAGGGGWAG